ncbi:uncharacterized protein si:ch211-130h14.4 [Notolabrus celidotus]|uniref:uncharacterized protein si:ch211-130h14.4 n=1 Tax=Notolabrus celidotus TaxID=1203425 RepID=UPI001490361C|nr:uncharacterized protein si:ch211-130h14.4 [Notolabrus celidotus]
MEQRHLEAYWNMHRLRDTLSRRYAALLEDKVSSQRSQQRSQLLQRREAARAESEDQNKQKQKKLVFSKLQHDDSYLKTLPKSSYYLFDRQSSLSLCSSSEIFDLQRQLAERGHLQTHRDLEDFYGRFQYGGHPSELQRSLEEVRRRVLESRPAADLERSVPGLCPTEDQREEDDSSNSRLSNQESASEESPAEEIFCSNKEKDGREPVFPEIKAPMFATLQPDFMKTFQNKMPDLVLPEIPKKSRRAEVYMRRLREMHDLCLSHMASSQRLLDRETDSLSWQEERGGDQGLTLPGVDSKQETTSQTLQPPLCSLKPPQSVQRERSASPKQLSRKTSSSRPLSSQTSLHDSAWSRETPAPLSMEDLCLLKHVEVVGCEVKFWRNYTEITDY